MFIGHFAVALAAKRPAPGASLGTLLLAAQFLDLLWPALLLAGIEHVRIDAGNTRFTPLEFYDYPISHSLLAVVGWAAFFGILYYTARRNPRVSLIMAGLVVSHWVLDAIVHRPDLPLTPGGMRYVGLGLWNSVAGTLILETVLYAAGVLVYVRSTTARDRIGSVGVWMFVIAIYAIYLANAFGPPPPDVRTLAWVGMAQWLLVLWAYRIDRHRDPRLRSASGG